jgi:hypothetical protein
LITFSRTTTNDDNNNKLATMADEGSQEGTPDEESPVDKNEGSSSGARSSDDQAISKYEPEGESSEVTEYEIRKPLQPLQTVVESVTSEGEMLELAMPSGIPPHLETPIHKMETQINFETPTQSNLSSRNNHLEDNYQSGAHVSFEVMRGGVEIDPANLSIPGSSSGGTDSFATIPSSGSDFGAKVYRREDSLPDEPLARGVSKTQGRENSHMSFTADLETGKQGGRGRRALVRVIWFEGSDCVLF